MERRPFFERFGPARILGELRQTIGRVGAAGLVVCADSFGALVAAGEVNELAADLDGCQVVEVRYVLGTDLAQTAVQAEEGCLEEVIRLFPATDVGVVTDIARASATNRSWARAMSRSRGGVARFEPVEQAACVGGLSQSFSPLRASTAADRKPNGILRFGSLAGQPGGRGRRWNVNLNVQRDHRLSHSLPKVDVGGGPMAVQSDLKGRIQKRERLWIMVREINAHEYEAEVIGSSVPVLLDVYGEHCGPCRQLAPTIDRLASQFKGRAKVLKLESGANPELAGGLAVSAVPTVLAFRDGKEVGRLVGVRPESAYRKLLEVAERDSPAKTAADAIGIATSEPQYR